MGLSRLAPVVERLAQPSLRLTAGKASARPVTRLGGRPNLPKGTQWPTWREAPLSFIAHFSLAELPEVDGLSLPREGALFFFYDADDQPWGFDPQNKGCARVVYDPSPLTDHPVRPFPEDVEAEVRFKGLALTPSLEESWPSVDEIRHLELSEEEFVAYLSREDELIHRVGGHPDAIQGGPRLMAQLVSNGLYCGDSSGYNEGLARGLDKGAGDWLLLLQVCSEERAGMMWGDMGRLYFMMHKEDLRRRCFDNVWLVLECS